MVITQLKVGKPPRLSALFPIEHYLMCTYQPKAEKKTRNKLSVTHSLQIT